MLCAGDIYVRDKISSIQVDAAIRIANVYRAWGKVDPTFDVRKAIIMDVDVYWLRAQDKPVPEWMTDEKAYQRHVAEQARFRSAGHE